MATKKQLLDSLVAIIRQRLAMGFYSRDQVIQFAAECGVEEGGEERQVRVEAERIYEQLARTRRATKRRWPRTTDCNRLDAAFDDLNGRGIMARHNWWCCQTCGAAAMVDEYKRLGGKKARPVIRGYAFYHVQDTEAAADGHGLWLAYGTTSRVKDDAAHDAAGEGIGREIVRVLQRHRLPAEWNGTIDSRISVPLDWKRRARPARWCEEEERG